MISTRLEVTASSSIRSDSCCRYYYEIDALREQGAISPRACRRLLLELGLLPFFFVEFFEERRGILVWLLRLRLLSLPSRMENLSLSPPLLSLRRLLLLFRKDLPVSSSVCSSMNFDVLDIRPRAVGSEFSGRNWSSCNKLLLKIVLKRMLANGSQVFESERILRS